MPLNFPKQKVNPSWRVLKEKKGRGERGIKSSSVFVFVPCSCASSLGTEEAEGKRKTAQCAVPPSAVCTGGRENILPWCKKGRWGRVRCLRNGMQETLQLGGSAFPKRNKDGRNFQKAQSQFGHYHCQSVTFPPSLLVQKLERGGPLGCSVSQQCLPSPAAMQTFLPPNWNWKIMLLWKQLTFYRLMLGGGHSAQEK